MSDTNTGLRIALALACVAFVAALLLGLKWLAGEGVDPFSAFGLGFVAVVAVWAIGAGAWSFGRWLSRRGAGR